MKKVVAFIAMGLMLFCLVFACVSILDSTSEHDDGQVAATVTNTPDVKNDTSSNQHDNAYYRISLDEWIGWKSLIDANGGLITTKDSINARNGIYVEYVIINDYDISSKSLINGELVAAGYTVNRYAFLQDRFDNANLKVVMPFITNYSNGGDGIIAKSDITSVKDLVGKKIAVPKFSEAQTLVEWLLRNSGLSASDQNKIRGNMVFCETADETARLFFSGNVDAAATWEPYLTNAKSSTDSHVLFDTSMSTNLILDGLVFRADFVNENPDFVNTLIKGALQAAPMYQTVFENIREMPMFELMSDEEIVEMSNGAKLATWADNQSLLTGIAVTMYKDMANIWKDLGETAYPEKAKAAFTAEPLMTLYGQFSTTATSFDSGMFNANTKETVLRDSNQNALMSMTLDIKFEVDSYKIASESYDELQEFAEIANILNGVYIQIEGNTAPVPGDDGVDFSYKRALSVAKYLQVMGVDTDRLIVIGNGDSNPIADNSTEEGKSLNRRVEVFFKKVVGY